MLPSIKSNTVLGAVFYVQILAEIKVHPKDSKGSSDNDFVSLIYCSLPCLLEVAIQIVVKMCSDYDCHQCIAVIYHYLTVHNDD